MQTLTAVVVLPPMILGMLLTVLSNQVREIIGDLQSNQILLIIVVFLAVIDVVVFSAMMTRFQRSRMYLD